MSNAEPGNVYTARWENNGNSVRTEVLDLRHSDDDKNTSEGWTWDEDSCVLTLNNVTIDSNDGFGLLLPENKEVETGQSYTIVDKYIKELGSKGVSLKSLRLLGDADYSNEETLLQNKDNKELVEK